ncbi:MAG: hypothetical protein NTX25_08255 [Proteobacteria bacterium]|nr:hypothetical protein [Pseudomonadota bacterium]
MYKRFLFKLFQIFLLVFGLFIKVTEVRADYKKATEGRDVVMNKLYPKATRFELGLPQVGFVMNQSYVNTLLLGVDGTYFLSETLGFALVYNQGVNQDKSERTCIEQFYYDPSNEVGLACGDAGNLTGADKDQDNFPRFGPAYVPIRELQQMLIANAVWTPVYGKQLIYFGTTSYFDLFVELGVGIANSKFYPKQEILKNGKKPRGIYTDPKDPNNDPAIATANNDKIGALPANPEFYGVEGRPTAKDEANPVINLGLGQKFHFGKLFHFKVYIRNFTLLGTDQGFENLFALYGGVGVRF